MRYLLALATLFTVILLFATCTEAPPPPHPNRQLAEQFCGSCHLFPKPDLLTRELWAFEVLPNMGAMLGRYGKLGREHYLGDASEREVLSAVYPLEAALDSLDWQRIQQYYLDEAPNKLSTGAPSPQILNLNRFRVQPVFDPADEGQPAFTTSISFDPDTKNIYAGGKTGQQGILRTFSARHDLLSTQSAPTVVSSVDPRAGTILTMGSLIPSDDPRGTLGNISPGSLAGPAFLEQLARPVDHLRLDLNLDGQPETIVAEYGNMVGHLSSFSSKASGVYTPTAVLSPTPGAIRLRRGDLDGDGNDDLFVLFAQGDERIEVWYSRTDGPERSRLLRFPPSYGSSDLQVIDFDHDGDLDLVYTNGDNFDYQPVAKAYHGVRLYLNDGEGNFEEAWFQEMDGAYGVEVADFDGDGDHDLAVIAYFIPPATRFTTSFLYFEQTEELTFTTSGFLKDPGHHYLCMTSGDVDQDGDVDLLIGNFAGYLPDGGRSTAKRGEASPVYLMLENVTR